MSRLNKPWIAALALCAFVSLAYHSLGWEPGYTVAQSSAMGDLIERVTCEDWLCELQKKRERHAR